LRSSENGLRSKQNVDTLEVQSVTEHIPLGMEKIQTLQWCPSAWDVVTLEIKGKVEGRMVNGKVVRCYTCNPEKCKAKKMSFCWLSRNILTVLSI
jgi:hypothetical protein